VSGDVTQNVKAPGQADPGRALPDQPDQGKERTPEYQAVSQIVGIKNQVGKNVHGGRPGNLTQDAPPDPIGTSQMKEAEGKDIRRHSEEKSDGKFFIALGIKTHPAPETVR